MTPAERSDRLVFIFPGFEALRYIWSISSVFRLNNERSRLKATQHIRSNLQSVGVLSFPKKKTYQK
jgi:hypothetical protein